jgi:hypothetical protein
MKQLAQVLITFLMFFSNSAHSQPKLQPGDLIFVSMDCYACKLIQETTRSPFSHVAIITKDESGKLLAIMAVQPKVMEVSVDFFYKNSLIPPQVMRMKSREGQDIAAIASHLARYYLGAPYDDEFTGAASGLVKHFLDFQNQSEFVLGPPKLYCSDLISYNFLNATGNRITPFPLVKMDFGKFQNQWEKMLGHPPPQGKLGISPGDIARSPELRIVE